MVQVRTLFWRQKVHAVINGMHNHPPSPAKIVRESLRESERVRKSPKESERVRHLLKITSISLVHPPRKSERVQKSPKESKRVRERPRKTEIRLHPPMQVYALAYVIII